MEAGPHRPYLLLVRCGRKSLHASWQQSQEGRSFDIIALAYEYDAIFPKDSQDQIDIVPGAKGFGYHKWISENQWIFERYKYIGLFDDDISTNHDDLNRLFRYCDILQVPLAQPALSIQSYYGLLITRQHSSFLHRWTNWVEVMVPVFRSELLCRCFPTFALDPQGACVEALWATCCDPVLGSIVIIDAVCVTHTRRTASAGSGDRTESNVLKAHGRRRLLSACQGITASIDNLCGITTQGEFLHLGEPRFVSLICGDMLNEGLYRHSLFDALGRGLSAKDVYSQYSLRLNMNFEAMKLDAASDALLHDLAQAAIVAGLAYEKLVEI